MYAPDHTAPVASLSRRAAVRVRAVAGLPPRRRGGQPGNRNRLVHGRYARAFLQRRAQVRGLLRRTRALLAELRVTASWRRFTMLTLRCPHAGKFYNIARAAPASFAFASTGIRHE